MMTLVKKPLMFTVYLGREAHQIADKLALKPGDFQKSERIYLTALAVYAVNFYLNCLGFETNLPTVNRDGAISKIGINGTNLVVKDKGELGCVYVLPRADFVEVEPEDFVGKIGCVVVEINREMEEATLLGFYPQITSTYCSISQLESLDDLPKYLSEVTEGER
jgi:hypothetical protein